MPIQSITCPPDHSAQIDALARALGADDFTMSDDSGPESYRARVEIRVSGASGPLPRKLEIVLLALGYDAWITCGYPSADYKRELAAMPGGDVAGRLTILDSIASGEGLATMAARLGVTVGMARTQEQRVLALVPSADLERLCRSHARMLAAG